MAASSARLISAERLRSLRPERMHGCLPATLWITGTPCGLAAPTIGIVGTRAPSSAALRFTSDLATQLAKAGVCVISGLARGIDAAAHRGALTGGGASIGVLAGGHDAFYPRENAGLAAEMTAAGGAVVTAHAPAVPPLPRRFLERNGIIAALSDAILVIEAPARSGSLNTASWAADAGIPVLAIPGDVDRPKVAGCLALIREGAILVRNAADVLEVLGVARPRIGRARSIHTPSARAAQFPHWDQAIATRDAETAATGEQALLRFLIDSGDASLEEAAAAIDAPISGILCAMQALVLRGVVHYGADGRYVPNAARGGAHPAARRAGVT